jgi:hypothetical protein
MTDTTLRKYVENQVRAKHSRRRMGLIIGVVLNLFVFGYMYFIHTQVTYITQPDNLVLAASGLVSSNIPNMKASAAAAIKEEAPQVATFLADAIRNEVPKLLREQLETMVVEYTTGLAGYAATQYNESFVAIVDIAEPEIKKAIDANSDAERDIVVMQFLERQVDVAVADLTKRNEGTDPVLSKLDASHDALVSLNKRVSDVTAKTGKGAGRKDQLEKKFLYTLWRFIQKEYPDLKEETTVEDAPALAEPIKKKK